MVGLTVAILGRLWIAYKKAVFYSLSALVVTGGVGIGQSVNIGKSLNLWNPAYTFSTNLASGAATSTITYILPPGPPNGLGTSVLSSSNTGTLSWIAQSSGGSGTPGGSNKQIQYNNSSSFGGAGGFEFTTAGIANTVSIFSAKKLSKSSGVPIPHILSTSPIVIRLLSAIASL